MIWFQEDKLDPIEFPGQSTSSPIKEFNIMNGELRIVILPAKEMNAQAPVFLEKNVLNLAQIFGKVNVFSVLLVVFLNMENAAENALKTNCS